MLSWIWPAACLSCGAAGRELCGRCAAALVPAPHVPTPRGLESCAALFSYEGTGKAAVAGLKYHGRTRLGPLGPALRELVPGHLDVVTWAPTSPKRRRVRGYDQAELIAMAVGRSAALPLRALLRRRSGGPALTGRSRAQRAGSVEFVARGPAPRRVLVVDDVVTTGATMAAAGAALLAAGAREVHGLALAATPEPGAAAG